MVLEVKKILQDILISIENIETYLGAKKIFNEYAENPLLQDAVERNLITIGEAMNILLKKEPQIPISNARRIVDTRNKLTHGYDEIEITQIWSIIIIHLPLLHKEVKELLEN